MGFRGLRRGEGDDRGVLYELGWFAGGQPMTMSARYTRRSCRRANQAGSTYTVFAVLLQVVEHFPIVQELCTEVLDTFVGFLLLGRY